MPASPPASPPASRRAAPPAQARRALSARGRVRPDTPAAALRDPGTPNDGATTPVWAAATRLRLTWPGALVCAALLVLLVGGRGAGFLLVVLGLTLWVGAASVRAGARGLGLRYRLDGDRLFPGARTRIAVEVVNRARWPVPLCRLSLRLPEGLHGRFRRVLTMGPRSLRRTAFEVTATQRGVYRLGDTRVVLADWFGLSTETADVRVPGRLIVYPAPWEAPPLPDRRRLPGGPRRDPTSPFPDDVPIGVRPYRSGDPLRTLAWKQSAHHGALLVREHPPVRAGVTWLYLDLCSDDWEPLYRHERGEAAICAAAALVRAELQARRAVGLGAWGELGEHTVHGLRLTAAAAWLRVPPRSDPGQAARLLELLAALRPAPGPDFGLRLRLEGQSLPWGARVLAVVPRDTPALWRIGAALGAHGHPTTLLVCERLLGRPAGLQSRYAPTVREVSRHA